MSKSKTKTHIAPKDNWSLTKSLCGLEYKFNREGDIIFSFAVSNYESVALIEKEYWCKTCKQLYERKERLKQGVLNKLNLNQTIISVEKETTCIDCGKPSEPGTSIPLCFDCNLKRVNLEPTKTKIKLVFVAEGDRFETEEVGKCEIVDCYFSISSIRYVYEVRCLEPEDDGIYFLTETALMAATKL